MNNLPESSLADWERIQEHSMDCQMECERCREPACDSRIYKFMQPEVEEDDTRPASREECFWFSLARDLVRGRGEIG
jgi:hypothetical protein